MVLEPISTVTDAGSDDPFSPIDEGGETSVIRNMFYMTDSLDEESYRCYSKSYFYGERQVCHEAGQDWLVQKINLGASVFLQSFQLFLLMSFLATLSCVLLTVRTSLREVQIHAWFSFSFDRRQSELFCVESAECLRQVCEYDESSVPFAGNSPSPSDAWPASFGSSPDGDRVLHAPPMSESPFSFGHNLTEPEVARSNLASATTPYRAPPRSHPPSFSMPLRASAANFTMPVSR